MGLLMELKKLAKGLKQARINAGQQKGFTWKNGEPKPLTQPEASEIIGISLRKYCQLEKAETGFLNKFSEQRTLDFIKKYGGL